MLAWPSAAANPFRSLQKPKGVPIMDAPQEKPKIPGNAYGTAEVAKSPITMEEWEELQKSALFSEEDVFYLRLSEEVLADQVGDLTVVL